MYKIVFSPTGYGLVAKPLSEYNFNLLKEPRTVLISGETNSETTVQDKVMIEYTPAVYEHTEDVVVDNITQNTDIKTFESVNENIATVNQSGQVSRVSDGSVQITVSGQYLKKGITVDVGRTSDSGQSFFDRWANGTLAKEITDTIDNRIADKTAGDKPIFSTQNHTTQTYVRNVNCWAYGLDLTSISPWNSTGANTRAGTLISPRHIIFATHYQITTGATVRFVMQNNTVVNRTLTGKLDIANTDITIGILDSDVPEGISFAKVLPNNWGSYLPNIVERVPSFVLDQEEKALVNDVNTIYTTSNSLFGFRTPTDSQRLVFYENKIGGDSGNPAFFIIDDELVLLTCWWYGGAGSGSNILKYKTEINSAMTSLGGSYQLTEKDLTSYPSY